MTTRLSRSKITALAAVALGAALMVASTAWACTAFLGTFEVTGDGDGMVTAIGEDHYEKNDPSSTSFGMNQSIEGSTEATSGATGGTDGAGSITVETGPTDDGVKLPASDEPHPTREEVGPYHVNFLNGPAYATHDQWTLDCMSYLIENTTEIIKLGEVIVGDNGKIEGQPTTFSLPDGTVPDEIGESAACISDEGGWYGNQAPITML